MPLDTIIIGGGPGGTATAKTLAKAGKSVVLVSDELGGECLNYGCIPTKTLLWSADLLERIGQAATFGINIENAKPDWEKVKQRRKDVVAKLRKNLQWSVTQSGVKIIEGRAKLVSGNSVEVSSAGKTEILEAANIVIAAGSESSSLPDFPFGNNIFGSHGILDLEALPKNLLIIGGGVIGVEFASVFHAFGTEVTIAEKSGKLIPREDAEISAELEKIFARKGIKNIKMDELLAEKRIKDFEKILVAVGRKPSCDGLGLDSAGVSHDAKGIGVNENMQTNIPHIFAIGDIAGKCMLASSAEREGILVANFLLGQKTRRVNYNAIPNTIFSLPEVASVGITENKAREDGIDIAIGKANYAANSKALIVNSRDGFVKVIGHKKTRKILGVHIIGEKATELIDGASWAISQNVTVDAFAENVYGHPIYGEVLKEACESLN